ncbi:low temperature requirement protein A [Paracoccus pacificus]|uniref:Low temperature requirement protein A n=1 Tax=Paracoccus pacificus TaxID=1463598 RepID=A0ABW4R6S7_9RHOB
MRKLIPLPPLAARDPNEHHRAATQLELFFDLISVIAIGAITANLHHAISEGHGLQAFPRFAFLFLAIWWAWMNFTWFASAFDHDGPVFRILVMVIMLGELIFAGGARYIFETLDMSFGVLGWCIMRVGMALLWYCASSNPEYERTALRYAGGIMLAQFGWVALYFLAPPGTGLFIGMAAVIWALEFSVPVYAESAKLTPFHRHHMIERYGLLTIISLGEVMVSICLGFGMMFGPEAEFAPAVTSVAAVFITFALFWLYFAEVDHLKSSTFSTAFSWGYVHVLIFGGIAVIGAVVAAQMDLVAGESKAAPDDVAWWLAASLAVVMAALWFVRDRHYALGIRGWALPVMSVVVLIGGALGLSTVAFAVLMWIALLWRVPQMTRFR